MLNETLNNKLSMFDSLHLATLGVMVLIVSLLYVFRDKIKNERFEKIFRFSMGIFLLVFESLFHIWVLSRNAYGVDMLPLTGFCALTNLLTIFSLLSGKTKNFSYLIYYALTGALLSLVFIDTAYAIPHFRFFHYFFVHFGFFISSLYYFFTNRIDFKPKKVHTATLILFVYSMGVLAFDIALNKNWFFLIENPVSAISDGLGSPWYTILWVMTIALVTYLWYFLLRFIHNKKINIPL